MSVSPILAAGAVLVACSLAVVPFAIEVGFRLRPGRKVLFASWGFSHALLALLAAVVTGLLVPRLPWPTPVFGQYASVLGALTAGSVVAWFAARKAQREPISALGFGARALEPRTLLLGPLMALLVVPLVFGLVFLVHGFAPLEANESLASRHGGDVYLWLAACVWAPIVGEVFFRAFLQPLFVQNFSERGGVAITAVLFGALHGGVAFVPLTALGMALGFVKLRSQSTWAAILGHATYNAIALLVAHHWQAWPCLPLAF